MGEKNFGHDLNNIHRTFFMFALKAFILLVM